jgi:hypothetical protein
VALYHQTHPSKIPKNQRFSGILLGPEFLKRGAEWFPVKEGRPIKGVRRRITLRPRKIAGKP